MSIWTRRQFLGAGTASLVASGELLSTRHALGSPWGLPVGLQLYSVREMLPTDFAGTLKKVAALGYQEVEAAGFFGRSAQEAKQALSDAGLRCVSGHYAWNAINDPAKVDAIIAFHKTIGAEYLICSSPGYKNPAPATTDGSRPHRRPYTMEDWQWNAEQFNTVGKQVRAAGLRFGYHNHVAEFTAEDGKVPYDELLRLTDPSLVTFEMDCGWVSVGGGDPIRYLRQHADRISMLHVKDFKRAAPDAGPEKPPVAAELGQGTTDFHAIFAAARKGEIKHYFVEQEQFDMPPWESLKIDADYMKNLSA